MKATTIICQFTNYSAMFDPDNVLFSMHSFIISDSKKYKNWITIQIYLFDFMESLNHNLVYHNYTVCMGISLNILIVSTETLSSYARLVLYNIIFYLSG